MQQQQLQHSCGGGGGGDQVVKRPVRHPNGTRGSFDPFYYPQTQQRQSHFVPKRTTATSRRSGLARKESDANPQQQPNGSTAARTQSRDWVFDEAVLTGAASPVLQRRAMQLPRQPSTSACRGSNVTAESEAFVGTKANSKFATVTELASITCTACRQQRQHGSKIMDGRRPQLKTKNDELADGSFEAFDQYTYTGEALFMYYARFFFLT